ncbi:hypothetical protein CEXT_504871 [Caerostris extrusa]|uniref:Uncharacterized protein n=1 Tax=Caerostris extrusa TaxID=172846 RepID=A0AAV4UIP9_CAEEX|nr:hypothetical protein CEXT_504871 [Caerostris extrusa]
MRSEIREIAFSHHFPQGLVQPHVKVPLRCRESMLRRLYKLRGQCLGAREVGRRRSSYSEKINPDQC